MTSKPHRHTGRNIALGLVLLFGLASLAAAAFVLRLLPQAPGLAELQALQAARPSVLMSADGKVLMSFTLARQEKVPLEKVSPHVTQALLATEDQRFYEHRGIDVYRTLAAALRTLTGDTQGGSTLTQQLARNLFPDDIGRERTLTRKVKELITAVRIERALDKHEILETYLNTAPFLYNVVGIEMAARTYYDKSAADLDVLESATLIGMLKGTRYYNPILHPERARERRNVVLGQLLKHGLLSEHDYQSLRERPLHVELHRQPPVLGNAPHFAVQLRQWLIDWADVHDYNIYRDGLVVQTTIDSRLQDVATQSVRRQADLLQAVADVEWSAPAMRLASASPQAYVRWRAKVHPFAYFWSRHRDLLETFVRETPQFKQAAKREGAAAVLRRLSADPAFLAALEREKTRLEAGFVAMDPASGEIKAWVGSRDFELDQFDHVAQAERQPGSTFKPIVYGAALESGLTPNRFYIDGPVEIPLADGSVWRPTDMSGASDLPMTLRDGLVYSKNTITVQVAQEVGVQPIVSLAKAMGVDQSKLDPVPSLALGTSPVTLLEMVSAYSTIAREGTYRKPLMVKRIVDRHGEVLAEFGGDTRRALSPDTARDLIDMMRGVVNRGTGTKIKTVFGIGADVAGKTGTTQGNTDGWFILMHPDLVAGAWVGFNDSRVALRSDYWGQGGHNAVLLVGDFFKTALKSGRIDATAAFPPPPHPPAPNPPLPWWEASAGDTAAPATEAAPGTEARAHEDDSGIGAGNKTGWITGRRADDGPPMSAEQLDRVLRNIGRNDPATVPAATRLDNDGERVWR